MGLHFDNEYYRKATEVGPYVPPMIPTKKYKENYDNIRWDRDDKKEQQD